MGGGETDPGAGAGGLLEAAAGGRSDLCGDSLSEDAMETETEKKSIHSASRMRTDLMECMSKARMYDSRGGQCGRAVHCDCVYMAADTIARGRTGITSPLGRLQCVTTTSKDRDCEMEPQVHATLYLPRNLDIMKCTEKRNAKPQ